MHVEAISVTEDSETGQSRPGSTVLCVDDLSAKAPCMQRAALYLPLLSQPDMVAESSWHLGLTPPPLEHLAEVCSYSCLTPH